MQRVSYACEMFVQIEPDKIEKWAREKHFVHEFLEDREFNIPKAQWPDR